MSLLKNKMIQQMQLKGYSTSSIKNYLSSIFSLIIGFYKLPLTVSRLASAELKPLSTEMFK